MGRKRRAAAPAPPPPPPPPQESSSESGSDSDQEEEPPRAAASKKPPQNPQPRTPAAAAESSEEESDSDAGAQDFQVRPVSHSPAKPAAPASRPESDEEGEQGESSESEPEVPEPVHKKSAATNKSKTAQPGDKKRLAPEPAPSGRVKKAKAEVGKAAPGATPAGKGKKAKAEQAKVAPVQTPAGKAKNSGGKPEKRGIDPSSSSKLETPARPHRPWSKQDAIKILDAMVAHIKKEGALPKNDVLLAAVQDRLDRKNFSPVDLYDKVRNLKRKYDNISVVPTEEDELQIYNLSDAIWGEKAKETSAAAAVAKSKKGQSKKQKMDGNSKGGTLKETANQNGDTQRGSKKGHAIEVKADRDVKSKLSKEDTPTATPSKSKQQVNDKEELGKDAKSGTSKETATTAAQNGDASTKRKRGKMEKDKMDIDPMSKDVSTGSQNGGTWTEEEIHKEDTGIGSSVQGTHRSFDELQDLFPNLAWCVETIEAQHPCGETLRRAFGLIGDEQANALESKIKKLRLLELKENNARLDLHKAVLKMLHGTVE